MRGRPQSRNEHCNPAGTLGGGRCEICPDVEEDSGIVSRCPRGHDVPDTILSAVQKDGRCRPGRKLRAQMREHRKWGSAGDPELRLLTLGTHRPRCCYQTYHGLGDPVPVDLPALVPRPRDPLGAEGSQRERRELSSTRRQATGDVLDCHRIIEVDKKNLDRWRHLARLHDRPHRMEEGPLEIPTAVGQAPIPQRGSPRRYPFARLRANAIAGLTPLAARSAFTRAFCLGLRLRRWPMYWPWSLRAARRSAESLRRRPRRDGFSGPAVAAWSSGASRWTARAMEASPVQIARMSRPIDLPRGFLTRLPPRCWRRMVARGNRPPGLANRPRRGANQRVFGSTRFRRVSWRSPPKIDKK